MNNDKSFYTIKAENRQFEEAQAFISEVYRLHFRGRLPSALCGLKKIQIAGTNGKGSTAAMLSSILCHAGLKTGLYTSPSLICVNERICLNGAMISDDDLCTYIPVITEAQENIGRKFGGFERITAAAMLYYLDNNVDIAVMETGLGGRYDTVSAVGELILASVTSIGMDHMVMLGNTIEQIAWEKCGIMRPNIPTVIHTQDRAAYNVIEKCAVENSSRLADVSDCEILHDAPTQNGRQMIIRAQGEEYCVNIPLRGAYQRENACNALMCALELRNMGYNISKSAIEAGFAEVRWDGRLQRVHADNIRSDIILDGAHNPHAMKAVADCITSVSGNKKYVILLSVMADKDIDGILEQAARFSDRAICVSTIERSCNSEILAEKARSHGIAAEAADNIEDGLKKANMLANGDDIYALGSLYLVGRVLSIVK